MIKNVLNYYKRGFSQRLEVLGSHFEDYNSYFAIVIKLAMKGIPFSL